MAKNISLPFIYECQVACRLTFTFCTHLWRVRDVCILLNMVANSYVAKENILNRLKKNFHRKKKRKGYYSMIFGIKHSIAKILFKTLPNFYIIGSIFHFVYWEN